MCQTACHSCFGWEGMWRGCACTGSGQGIERDVVRVCATSLLVVLHKFQAEKWGAAAQNDTVLLIPRV